MSLKLIIIVLACFLQQIATQTFSYSCSLATGCGTCHSSNTCLYNCTTGYLFKYWACSNCIDPKCLFCANPAVCDQCDPGSGFLPLSNTCAACTDTRCATCYLNTNLCSYCLGLKLGVSATGLCAACTDPKCN